MLKRSGFIAILLTGALNMLNAATINAIAAIVDNEPITLYDVSNTKQRLGVSDGEALNLLIKDRLEQAQIKALSLSASPFEINERIAELASKNGLTPAQFRTQMSNQGISSQQLSEDVKHAILQEKLYKAVLASANKSVTEQKAREYYEANKSQFQSYANVNVRVFRSTDARALEAKASNPNSDVAGVNVSDESIEIASARPELASMLVRIDNGAYTPIMRAPSGFEVMQVLSKNGTAALPFDTVKDALLNQMFNAERNKMLADYFEKLRAKAKIEILR